MITYLKGNIFRSPAQVLVNTVNTSYNGVEEFVPSDELCAFWSYLRDVGIIDGKIPIQFAKHANLLFKR